MAHKMNILELSFEMFHGFLSAFSTVASVLVSHAQYVRAIAFNPILRLFYKG